MTTQTRERHGAPKTSEHSAAPRRCWTTDRLRKLRASAEVEGFSAIHLVEHLGLPCTRCWGAVERLGSFEISLDARLLPVEPEGLAPSADPVVLALRTLGGWPPRRWLWPSHRAALDAAVGPLGFLALVLEEARRLARLGEQGAEELRPWLQYLEVMDEQGAELAALHARALAYLAEAHARAGDMRSAAPVLARADRRIEQRPADETLQTLLTVTRAHVVAPSHPQLARARLELACDRLASSADGDRRAEVFLELAAFHLGRGEARQAWEALNRAGRLLRESDAPLLAERHRRYRVSWALLLAETARPGLQRLAAHARAFGHWSERLDVPAALDAETWRDTESLADRMAEVWDEYMPKALQEALGWLDPGEAAAEAEDGSGDELAMRLDLRIVLAGVLLRLEEEDRAEAEVDAVRRALDGAPHLRSRFDRPRRILGDLLKECSDVAPVIELVRPVVRVLERLREPVQTSHERAE